MAEQRIEEKHVIEQAVFDLSFGAERAASAETDVLRSMIQQQLLTVVESVFDAVSQERAGYIDQLTIDLGVIDTEDFQGDLKNRLSMRLKAALEEQLPLRASAAAARGARRPVSSDLAALQSLLLRGHLPLNQGFAKGRTINEWVSAVLSHSSEDFANFLRTAKPKSRIFQRLIYQCSEKNLVEIARLLAPVQSQDLPSLVKNLKAVLDEVAGGVLGSGVLAHDIWTSVFDLLLETKTGTIDAKRVIDCLKGKIGEQQGLSQKEVQNLLSALDTLQGSVGSGNALASRQKDEEAVVLRALAALKSTLHDAITRARPDLLKTLWPRVLRDHRLLLRSMLMDHGRLLRVRRGLSCQFPDAMLADLVHVIDPEASPFIHEIVSRPSLFQQGKQGEAGKQEEAESESKIKHQLWEFTLSYLIVERGSRFNQKSYLESLIVQMAAHENRAYSQLLQGLIARLDDVALPNRVKNEMRDLLATLLEEDESSGPMAALSESLAVSNQSGLIQAYEQLEVLRRALWGDDAWQERRARPNEAETLSAIDALLRFEPELLLQFFQRLQAETEIAGVLPRRLSDAVLFGLIKAFLSLRAPERVDSVARGDTDLMQAIETHAHRVNHIKSYYAQILGHLLQNEEIDFEAILKRVEIAPQAILDDADGPQKYALETADDIASQTLRTRIREALAQGRHGAIAALWPDFVRVNGDWLRETFLRLGRQSAVRKKLATDFPDAMLIDLVVLVAPEAGEVVHGIVAQPHLFQALSTTPQETEKQSKAQFWEFTLSYLVAERGSRFNRKSYLGSLITQMAAHHNRSSQAVLSTLKMALETIEAAHAAKSEMLLILRELSQETAPQKPTAQVEPSSDIIRMQDAAAMCDAVAVFLTQGLWPGKTAAQRKTALSEIIESLFQSYPERLFQLFEQLSHRGRIEIAAPLSDSESIYARLIEIFLLHTGAGASSDFMQAMARHAARSDHQALFFQHVLGCLIEKRIVDFEAILLQTAGDGNDSTATAFESVSKTDDVSLSHTPSHTPQREAATAVRSPESVFDELEKTLLSSASLSAKEARSFVEMVDMLLVRSSKDFFHILNRLLANPKRAGRLIHLLPEPMLVRVLRHMRPAVFDGLLRWADCIAGAAGTKEVALSPSRITRLKWQFIFRYLFEEGRRFHARRFVALFTDALAKDAYYADAKAFRLLLRAQLESRLLLRRKIEVLEVMDQLIHPEKAELPQDEQTLSSETAQVIDAEEETWDETIHLENAGLVIAAPYLERLFDLLDLTEAQAFKNPEAAARAVHLLQFLVDESSDTPEYQLVLNKILCGLGPVIPIPRQITVSAREKELIEGLIQGMIANWKQIGATSLAGFRSSFLQREGTLQRKGDDWSLNVEAKGFDVLLDYIPWSFSMVKLPWMLRVIHVKWRTNNAS